MSYPKIAQLKTVHALRARLDELGLSLPIDESIQSAAKGSPLAAPLTLGGRTVGNRWCIHPMEGWDAEPDGSPSELTLRRWRNFGVSGAKLIWGGEAAAVRPDGRANVRQTLATSDNLAGLSKLLSTARSSHRDRFGSDADLLVGLQLTHSGRFARDLNGAAPRIAYHHPLLDSKFHIDPRDARIVLTDQELDELADAFVVAASVAAEVGFDFVDVKACHGYLLHELLSARLRPGRYGGDFAGRTRMLTSMIARIREQIPQVLVGVRLSVYDTVPYQTSRELGQPYDYASQLPYQLGFGVDQNDPLQIDLEEPFRLLKLLHELGVFAVNFTCGSPYYSPHIQRPAIFPPSDGYLPPEDPLCGVVRQIDIARQCKQAVPDLPLIGTGYSYLQDFLPLVAQAVVRAGWIDSVGLGRMVLSYPELPADVLAGRPLARKQICRTFSDCTTAPRLGFVSGCYPLDRFYKGMPAAAEITRHKQAGVETPPS